MAAVALFARAASRVARHAGLGRTTLGFERALCSASPGGRAKKEETGAGVSVAVTLTSPPAEAEAEGEGDALGDLTPSAIVARLDRFIVGQADAKRSVAVALRDRWRRRRIEDEDLRQEITPKNILMIGPTGCGKTEIARRVAKLADSPFVKVEATKYTEVGFHGRDVDEIMRDLVENAIALTKERWKRRSHASIQADVESKLLDILAGAEDIGESREALRRMLRNGLFEDRMIDVDVPPGHGSGGSGPGSPSPLNIIQADKGQKIHVEVNTDNLWFKNLHGDPRLGSKHKPRRMKVKDARALLAEAEAESAMNEQEVVREALTVAAEEGIVFIDEMDKIVTSSDSGRVAEASSEGVQGDLLPIIEGCSVKTKYGNLHTDHVLFIASGAFLNCKPSDMMAELQGRLPVRVELDGLTQDDIFRILTQTERNLIDQHTALLATEGVALEFTEDALREVARVTSEANRLVENIGARRLHTVLERVLDDVSFGASEAGAGAREEGRDPHRIVIDAAKVTEKVGHLIAQPNLSHYIL